MTEKRWREAARILADATRSGHRVDALPKGLAPVSVADALTIQKLCVEDLALAVAGWKVNVSPEGDVVWGAIFDVDCFQSPAIVPATRMPMMGVEGEIAFRFDRDLPARAAPYERNELEEALTSFPAIEIVGTRFADYASAPSLDRLADRMSNGGMVLGKPMSGWRDLDLSNLRVVLSRDGEVLIDRIGGHARGNPLLPALEFVRAVQTGQAFRAGQFITTGTFTGMTLGSARQHFAVEFGGHPPVTLTFC